MNGRAEKLALMLTLAQEDAGEELRASIARVRERAVDEAAGRTEGWAAMDASARLIRMLELGLGAVCVDDVMSAPPCEEGACKEEESAAKWRFLSDSGLFNCAALALIADMPGERVMLRLESEAYLPVEWWQEAAFAGEVSDKLGAVSPIVLLTAERGRGGREYIDLHTGERLTDCVREKGGALRRVQLRADGTEAGWKQEAAAEQTSASGKPGGNVYLLVGLMILMGGAIYALYKLMFMMAS